MENKALMQSTNNANPAPAPIPAPSNTATPSQTPLTSTTDIKVKHEDNMEAPNPAESGGAYLHAWGCPLCHRDPVEPRVANCGHTFCLMCLKDVQVTAELFKYLPRCNLCQEDISDANPVAFNSHRTLPPLAPVNSSPVAGRDREQLPPRGPTVGEALAALHQRAQDPRNFYASGLSGMQSAYQDQYQQQYTPHTQQLPHMQPMPRYDGPQGYIGHPNSSDRIVSTIEYSPRGSASTISETKTSQSSLEKQPAVKGVGLQDLRFYLKGDLDRDGQARYIIQQNGGRLLASAKKHTNYVVMGKSAKKTKAMKDNFGGLMINEPTFWDLMRQKIGAEVLNEQLQLQENGEEERAATEEAKLIAELAKLEKKTSEVKRKLEQLADDKVGVKRQKAESSGLSELSSFVEK